jgi:hypothetical protein
MAASITTAVRKTVKGLTSSEAEDRLTAAETGDTVTLKVGSFPRITTLHAQIISTTLSDNLLVRTRGTGCLIRITTTSRHSGAAVTACDREGLPVEPLGKLHSLSIN